MLLPAVDDFERHSHGMRADHAITINLRNAARANIFDLVG